MSQKFRAEEYFKGHYRLMAQAIERNDMALLKQLAQDQDLTLKGEKDIGLLWFAIARQNFDAIRTLVELGVNPDTQMAKGIGSALQYTFHKHDDTRYLKAMLDGGLDPNHQHPGYHLMLHRAVFGGLEHVKLLLKHGARINDRSRIGGTALTEAIYSRKPDIAIYLLKQGSEFDNCTTAGVSPAWAVHLAIDRYIPGSPMHNDFSRLRDLMIQKGAKWPPDSPPEVRNQMRARGETPVIPYGHKR